MAEAGTESTSSARNQEIELNIDYFIKTLFGRLVLIELVITLICGACSSGTASYCPGHYGFLAFVAWTSFLNLLIFTILKLVGLWDKFRMFWIFPHPIIPVICYTAAVVGFLIGSCLAAACASRASTTGSGTAAAVFGFCCLFLFGLELFFAVKAYRSSENEARQQAPKYDPEPAAVV